MSKRHLDDFEQQDKMPEEIHSMINERRADKEEERRLREEMRR
jgi:hypothetical protein